MHETCAIDEYIDRAQLALDFLGKRLDCRGRSHVELAALGGIQTVKLVRFKIGSDNLCTLRGEGFRNGASDALTRRGDERQFILQTLAHLDLLNDCPAARISVRHADILQLA